jgi:hypothetical protein
MREDPVCLGDTFSGIFPRLASKEIVTGLLCSVSQGCQSGPPSARAYAIHGPAVHGGGVPGLSSADPAGLRGQAAAGLPCHRCLEA